MSLEIILFIILSLISAISSIMMITRKNAVISALFLILNFFALAGLYLLLNAQFIAVVQIIVYAGAIMVLFLFVIMLLRTDNESTIFSGNKVLKYLSVAIGALVFFQIAFLIFYGRPSKNLNLQEDVANKIGTIQSIGEKLYTDYIIPFEVAGFLLLAATIGAIILAKKKFE
ncbi:NADH-quinone oxidoreductase subunit J family protein [Rosettibacter firmus]|uniref:NADH-quinone oxidoreductase subunit J family protein n=1 Tax=Rosettibacter firmus TaxID=3111522 RepID=UPI00336BF667